MREKPIKMGPASTIPLNPAIKNIDRMVKLELNTTVDKCDKINISEILKAVTSKSKGF